MTGAIRAGSTIFESTMPKSIPLMPAPTMVAPISPPKRAWDELDGRPSSQVSMFQVMAPISPAKISDRNRSVPASMIASSRMMPPEIVLETSVDRKAPTRLRTAARRTAVLGFSAPVAIGVAMAFAVS